MMRHRIREPETTEINFLAVRLAPDVERHQDECFGGRSFRAIKNKEDV